MEWVSLHPRTASDFEIERFWNWFQRIAPELSVDLDNTELLNELDARVAALGDVSWEVGPGIEKENSLVISPDGSKEWIGSTQHIVELAPTLDAWEIHWARPSRRWDLRFSIECESGSTLNVDARQWRYVLIEFPDQMFDIIVEQDNLDGIPECDRYTAAVVLLDGILGESKRMELIGRVDPVATFSITHERSANPISNLARHLEALRSK